MDLLTWLSSHRGRSKCDPTHPKPSNKFGVVGVASGIYPRDPGLALVPGSPRDQRPRQTPWQCRPPPASPPPVSTQRQTGPGHRGTKANRWETMWLGKFYLNSCWLPSHQFWLHVIADAIIAILHKVVVRTTVTTVGRGWAKGCILLWQGWHSTLERTEAGSRRSRWDPEI